MRDLNSKTKVRGREIAQQIKVLARFGILALKLKARHGYTHP